MHYASLNLLSMWSQHMLQLLNNHCGQSDTKLSFIQGLLQTHMNTTPARISSPSLYWLLKTNRKWVHCLREFQAQAIFTWALVLTTYPLHFFYPSSTFQSLGKKYLFITSICYFCVIYHIMNHYWHILWT